MKTTFHVKPLYYATIFAMLQVAFAEAQNIDSLRHVIAIAAEDTSKVNALNELGWALMYENPDTAIIIGNQSLTLANNLASEKHKAKSLLNFGVYHAQLGDYKTALNYYKDALLIYEKLMHLRGQATANNYLGIACAELSQFAEALEHYHKSLALMTALENKRGISIAFNSIGNVYVDMADYDQGIEYHQKSLKLKEELGDKDGMAFSYNNLGVAYKKKSDFTKALEYYFKSVELRKEMNDKRGMAIALDNIGGIYRLQRDYAKALDYHHQSLEIVKELGYRAGMAYSYNNMGGIYAEQEDYAHALEYFRHALKILTSLGLKSGMAIAYNNIGGSFTQLHVTGTKDKMNTEIKKTSVLLDSALHYLQEALRINTELDIKESMIYNAHDIADVYLERNQYSKAADFFTKAMHISSSIGNPEGEFEANRGLSLTYKAWAKASFDTRTKSDYLMKSLTYHEQYINLRDSVFNEEKEREIGKLEARHEYEMAEIQRKQEEKEKARIAEAARKRKNDLQYSGILLGLCMLFGGVFFMRKLKLPKWAVGLAVFVPFLILFEFLLVLTDPYFERLTGGEPGLKLATNAIMAGLIFPVHNFLESLMKKRLFQKPIPKEETVSVSE